jgi:hypothetical protein
MVVSTDQNNEKVHMNIGLEKLPFPFQNFQHGIILSLLPLCTQNDARQGSQAKRGRKGTISRPLYSLINFW